MIEAFGNFDGVVDGVIRPNIFIKRIVKIEMVKFLKVDLGDISIDKFTLRNPVYTFTPSAW